MLRFLAASMIAWVVGAIAPMPALAQTSTPGPYVIDIRGAMVGAPGAPFYPPITTVTTETTITVPKRAFGFSGGVHLYPFRLGPSRVGFGLDLARARGTAVSTSEVKASMTVTTIAPQISFNFGAREGWSYLSGGYGTTQTRAEVVTPSSDTTPAATASLDHRTPTINIGGGARWFLQQHLAVGFDVRFHRLRAASGIPSKQSVGFAVGMSIR